MTFGMHRSNTYLVSIELTSIHLFLSLFLKRDNDESNEHVQEKERKHNNETHVVQRHLYLVVSYWPHVLHSRINRVIHPPARRKREDIFHCLEILNKV